MKVCDCAAYNKPFRRRNFNHCEDSLMSCRYSWSVEICRRRFCAFVTYIFTYLLTYLLTYSTVQNPSWEANWFKASQEIPCISRNPKVHYRTHKRPPPILILGHPNPVHIPTSHLLEIHPNIIHPSMPRSPQWSLSLRFPHQDIHTYIHTFQCM